LSFCYLSGVLSFLCEFVAFFSFLWFAFWLICLLDDLPGFVFPFTRGQMSQELNEPAGKQAREQVVQKANQQSVINRMSHFFASLIYVLFLQE